MRTITRLSLCGLLFASLASCAGNSDYLPSQITAYEPEDCKPVVEQDLDRTHIDRNKISEIVYLTHHYAGGEMGDDYRYQAWLSFNSCTGHYVLDMNKYCQIERRFTTASCRTEDIVAASK